MGMLRVCAGLLLSVIAVGCGSSVTLPDDRAGDDAASGEASAEVDSGRVEESDSGTIDSASIDTGTTVDSGTSVDSAVDTGTSLDTGTSVDTGTVGPSCFSSEKVCDAKCVSKSRPEVGCAAASCTACPVPANSVATCSSGGCASACLADYADCNGSASDGCEKNLQTDGGNCGACGHSCAGDACVAGMCVPKTLAVGQNDPSDLAVDELDLYWTNTGANQVVRVAKVGGTATIVASSQPSPLGIALDDTHVYWTQNTTPGAVVRAPKSGGSPQVIASSQYYAFRLVLSGSTVYFIGDTTSGFVRSVPKTGGTVTDLQSASSPKGLAYDGTKLFWSAWNEIRKADASALAPPTKLSTAESFPAALAADESDVFWLDMYANKIRKVSKPGGAPTTLASLTSGTPRGSIAIDATYVYFIDPKGNALRKVPKSGGAATTVAKASDPRGIVVDANYVYWTNGGDGTVMRVAK